MYVCVCVLSVSECLSVRCISVGLIYRALERVLTSLSESLMSFLPSAFCPSAPISSSKPRALSPSLLCIRPTVSYSISPSESGAREPNVCGKNACGKWCRIVSITTKPPTPPPNVCTPKRCAGKISQHLRLLTIKHEIKVFHFIFQLFVSFTHEVIILSVRSLRTKAIMSRSIIGTSRLLLWYTVLPPGFMNRQRVYMCVSVCVCCNHGL